MQSKSELTCAEIDLSTQDDKDRVGKFADLKPNCACENQSLSIESPGLIESNEDIARMVCTPMHVHSKRPELKSSFFSHITSCGASAQRLKHASDIELASCIASLIEGREDRAWLGLVVASADAIRSLTLGPQGKQSFCVADAAIQDNPGHAEIHCAYRIPEADEIEYRRELMLVFNATKIEHRRSLRKGAVWTLIPENLRERTLPDQWSSLN